MHSMTLIRFVDTVKDELTGEYVETERMEVMGTNMLMYLLNKAIPYEIVRAFK